MSPVRPFGALRPSCPCSASLGLQPTLPMAPDPVSPAGAISPCPGAAAPGLVSSSPQPGPARPWGHEAEDLRFFRVKLITGLVFWLGHSPVGCGGYTKISELAASLRWLARSIFITSLIVGKEEMGKFKLFSQTAVLQTLFSP